MEKDFDKWNEKKKRIHTIPHMPFFHEREIWFCYIGVNVGFEQDGGEDFLRPVLIVRKFNNEIFWGIPLTKSKKKKISKDNERYYHPFIFVEGITSLAILSQIRLIDARRLGRRIGGLSEEEFGSLTKKLKALLP